MKENLKTFLKQCHQTLKTTKKPTPAEFKKISLVTGLGVTVIGGIGFAISTLMSFI